MISQSITAAFLIIGDEILSGRTKDENLNFLANQLTDIGIDLQEVRVVKDIESQIIETINQFRYKYSYVFTSGGIGPTHDDITSQSIAKAFDDIYEQNQQATDILVKYYGEENINDAKLKMSYLPRKALLLDNPISSAPGFYIENVFVMAGVPKIFQAMFFAAKAGLKTDDKIISKEIILSLSESTIANILAVTQNRYENISIGSYPFKNVTAVVLRSKSKELLEKAVGDILGFVNKLDPKAILKIQE